MGVKYGTAALLLLLCYESFPAGRVLLDKGVVGLEEVLGELLPFLLREAAAGRLRWRHGECGGWYEHARVREGRQVATEPQGGYGL